MKRIIAIDPGKVGFISVLDEGGWRFLSLAESDDRAIADFLRENYREDSVAVMEEVHSIFGASAGSTFSFGSIYGMLYGMLIAYGYSYHLVQPKTWQSEIWDNKDKVFLPPKINKNGKTIKRINTKETSINAAKRLFPGIDFRRNNSCKKIDDNKVDSVLILEYARRKNL